MKKLILNGTQTMEAQKIVRHERKIEENEVAKTVYDVFGYDENSKVWSFYNLTSDIFQLEEGAEWDIEVDEIAQLKLMQAEQFEAILELIGGM